MHDSVYRQTRRTALKSAGAAGIVALSGCLSTTGGGGSTEITVLTTQTSSQSQQAWEELRSEFEAETDEVVTFEYVGFGDASERVAAMLRAGNPPEVVQRPIGEIAAFYDEGLLAPVTDEIDDMGDFPDATVYTRDGEKWSTPFAIVVSNANVRTDLLAEVGIDLPSTRTGIDWETYYDWIEQLDEIDGVRGNAVVAAQTGKGHVDAIDWLWGNGVDVWSGPADEIEVSIDRGQNRERTIETLEYLKSLAAFSPETGGWGYGDTSGALASGAVASCVYSFGRIYETVESSNPDLADNVAGIETPRQRRKSDGVSTYGSVGSFGYLADSGNLEGAKKFMTHVYNSEYYLDLVLAPPLHNSPPTADLFESDAYKNNPVIKKFPEEARMKQELIEHAKPYSQVSDDNQPVPGAGRAYGNGVLGGMVAKVILQDMEYAQAIDETAAELRSLL